MHAPPTRPQLLVPPVVGCADQGVDAGHGGFDVGTRDLLEQRVTPAGQRKIIILDDAQADIAQHDGRGIEVAQRTQPGFAMRFFCRAENVGCQRVEEFDRIVECHGFQGLEQGGERCRATRLLQHGESRRLAGAGRPRQPAERGSRQTGGHGRTQAMGANGVDAFQVPQQFRRRTPPRGGAQVLQAGECSVVGREQCRELLSLLVGQSARQTMPEPQIGAVAHTADQALQRGDAGKQHLVRHQPGGCSIEQQSRTVIPGPAEHVEPARQPEASRGVLLQVAKPVALADHRNVAPALPAVAIGVEAGRRHLVELTCDGGDHRGRRLARIVEKGAKEAGGAELDRKADPVVRAAHLTDQFTISGIEVEIAGELLPAEVAGVSAVSRALLVGEKTARHGVRNSGLLQWSGAGPRINGLFPTKLLRETSQFCDKFRTRPGARS